MIWFYSRGDAVMKIETRFNSESHQYELIWHDADGSMRRESFDSQAEFRTRLTSIETALHAEQWKQSGPPTIDPDGWRIS